MMGWERQSVSVPPSYNSYLPSLIHFTSEAPARCCLTASWQDIQLVKVKGGGLRFLVSPPLLYPRQQYRYDKGAGFGGRLVNYHDMFYLIRSD